MPGLQRFRIEINALVTHAFFDYDHLASLHGRIGERISHNEAGFVSEPNSVTCIPVSIFRRLTYARKPSA